MGMEIKRQDYNQAKISAERAIFKAKKMSRGRCFVRTWIERIGMEMGLGYPCS